MDLPQILKLFKIFPKLLVLLDLQYLLSTVANDNSGVALSLAYVLQGEQFQRQPALEVRVAAASAVAALAQDSSRGAQNQLNSSDPVYTSHMLHLLIHPSFTSTPHPDRLLVYPFENVHIHESLTFLKHALH